MITVVTDNLDGQTISVSYSFYGGDVYLNTHSGGDGLVQRSLHSLFLSHKLFKLPLPPFRIPK